MEDNKELYTTQEVAKLVGVSARTIQHWADMDLIKVLKTPGGHRRIHDYELKRLLSKLNDMPLSNGKNIKQTCNILIVEDDLDLQKLYAMEIASWNTDTKITCVSDGYEALITIGEKSPDIIITDLHMPNLDGFHMLDIVLNRKALKGSKIIVVTGLNKEEIEQRGQIDPSIEILAKPVPFDELSGIVLGKINGNK
jgi:excisionase family DNA binding protein